jgi:hypothetical protein
MRRGDFAGAWMVSDRLRTPIPPDEWAKPRHLQRIWTGAPVNGRRVLVRCYHGLGDTIQFVRFIPRLVALAREVTLWVQPALIPLLRPAADGARIEALHDGTPEAAYDVDVEIMELAYLFRVDRDALADFAPYLSVPDVPALECRAPGPRVALAWRGGAWATRRAVPPDLAAGLVPPELGVDVLLPDLTPAERAWCTLPPGPTTLLAAAARIARADLVVTVDTVFAHLAGALGRPVWILLPADADWRWMRDTTRSPWYPTARLYRQTCDGDWVPVAAQVRADLEAWMRERVGAASVSAHGGRDAAPPP